MGSTAEQIEEFLDKLNDDTDFRDRLICDTAAVLEEYDIEYDPAYLVPPSKVQLPSEGEVNANREAFKAALFTDELPGANRPKFTL